MKKKLTQKEKEQHYFEMFRKNYALPHGTIDHDDKPDVILEGERKIGIEITNFYLEKGELLESEQRQRDLRASIISNAQRTYQTRNKEKIALTIEFDRTNPIRGLKPVIQKLVGLAEQIKRNRTGHVDSLFFQNIPEISYVYLYTEEYAAPKWKGVQVYSGSLMARDDLIRIVRDKEEHSKQYKKCDSLWLLVVVEFMDRAQDQEIQIDDFQKIESDVFEKIIVYKPKFAHVLEAK